jgi:hypothetical protein
MTRRWIGAELTCLILVILAASSGCSIFIAESGRQDVLEPVREGGTRAEIRKRLGSPANVGACPDGRPFDRFRVRQPIPWLAKTLYWPFWLAQGGGQEAAKLFVLWLVFEPIFTPIALIVSEAEKMPVTVVYGLDERVVYAFTGRQEWRFYEAVQPLNDEVRSALRQTDPSTWVPQVTAYVDELHRRAACTGTTLAPEEETALAELVPIVGEGTWGIATPDEAVDKFDDITSRISHRRPPLAPRAPHQPRPARDAAHALERGVKRL